MACTECQRLDKAEIDCQLSAGTAQDLLRSFSPEPPYGDVARQILRAREHEAERTRASLEDARRQRIAHGETHALTMSR